MADGRAVDRSLIDESLVGLLGRRAGEMPERRLYTFLQDGEVEAASFTYAGLDRRARAIAALLQEQTVPGDRTLLLFPPGLDFIAAFFGCLYAGVVAVPAYPPRPNQSLAKLRSITLGARPAVALTTSAIAGRVEDWVGQEPALAALRWLPVDELDAAALARAEAWRDPGVGPDTLAFLQYTSGSTSAPKGVMVTHGNLLANEEMIQHACRHDSGSSFVSWLPLYHDMGLIGSVLQPLYLGSSCVLMAPVAFLQKPMRWLRAISRYRAHTSGAPSFAYELCVRRSTPEERAEIDLSSWRIAFNGAEPVRASTLESFACAFAPAGFRREAFFPCYGLAEATLIVSGSGGARPAVVKPVRGRELDSHRVVDAYAGGDGVRYLVGCGAPILDTEVAIVDPETLQRCPPGGVGEIWVAGPSVAQGYWNQPEESERSFRARIAGSGAGPFLRTGDLGFLDEGRLFVTGRLKDLIILRGVNHYPQDLELTVERQHAGLRPGGGAAFAVEIDGEERLVVVQEVEPRWRADNTEVLDAIVQALAEHHEVAAWAVLLVKAGAIPKTSSGKVQRFECRRRFLAGELPVVAERRLDAAEGAPAEAAEPGDADGGDWLAALVAEKARIDPRRLRRDQPIARQGLDSLGAIELMHEIETRCGVSLSLPELLEASLEQLAAQVRGARPTAAAATATPASEGPQPLSQGQRALWFLWRRDPESPAYNLAHAVRVTVPLDAAALRRAFQALLDRHEGLRASFTGDGAGVWQQARSGEEVWFREEDATGWSTAELDARLAAEAHRPFDLAAGPLLRVHCFARGAAEAVLLVAIHHIVADFWSFAVLLAELRDLYAAEASGRPALLPPLSGRYADHVRREAERLAGPEGERLAAYWERRLAGAPEALDLPTDRRRRSPAAAIGASHPVWLDGATAEALHAAAAGQGATLYMVLLAAFHAFLGRWTSRRDLLVGSPSVGRGRAADAGIVGYFVNPLVLRADLAGDPGFEEVLARTRRTVLDAFEHQDFPFAQLVERLRPRRDAERSPLVQVMFAFQKPPSQAGEGLAGFALGRPGRRLRLGALELESMALEGRPLQFDLTLMLAELDGGLAGVLDYDPELFDAATIERLARHWTTLLTAAASPLRPLSELPLLSSAELDQVLRAWNRTGRALPPVAGVDELIAAQPAEALAVAAGGVRLTYGQLRGRAAQLGARLRGLGVGPEVVVAVFLDRSVEMVVALLAVLEAGGAYLPIDPETPAARIAFLLEDSAAPLVLTTGALAAALPAGAPAVLVDGEAEGGATVPAAHAVPQNLAYVIYTSGSTGRPKGVAISRAGLLNLVAWHLEAFALTGEDRVSQLAGLGFDASVWEIWSCLAAGASLHLAPEWARTSPAGVWKWLDAEGITTAFLPTPLAEAALGSGRRAGGRLRLLLTGGDRLCLPVHLATPFTLVNNYGPTESTVVVASGDVAQGAPAGARPPLGRPIANTRVYLLDAWMQAVAPGAPGELYVAGAGLARGYLGQPGLTAERFLPDPFAAEPGGRLYRTGDLCRILPGSRADGSLEFLGRIDQQTKVRGFRIEPGEIEAVLARHPAVAEVIVEAREAAAGGAVLVAWVVPAAGAALAAEELRELAAAALPAYMVPAAFVTLDALPLTVNGKVDRRALPAPGLDARGGALARTPVEELLAGLWEELLKVEGVGPGDDFFALGGHSLLATQLASRVREALGVELPVRAVFDAPTLAELATAVERVSGRLSRTARRVPPLTRAVEGGGPRPLSFAQRRLWFLGQLDPDSAAYNIPFAARLTGRLDRAALAAAFAEIARRHEAVRATFAALDGEPVQSVAAPPPARLPLVDLAGLPAAARDAESGRLARGEAAGRFDLAAGPLVRTLALRLGEDDHLVLVTLHHIAGDGWSMGVLARELEALYGAFAAGLPSPLPELPLQYSDFAAWQRQWLCGAVEAGELAYWRARLAGAPAVLELPSDRPRPAVRRQRGGTRSSVLARPLAEALSALGRREGATLFMTLLAAFQTLLGRWAGRDDLVVGTPIAGRNRIETEDLIGFFVNTLALRGDLAGDPSFRELLARTRAAALDAHAHQDLPFERLVEELDAPRDLSHAPLVQVLFSLQNTPAVELALPGLDVRVLPLDTGTAKLDLTLTATPGADGIRLALGHAMDVVDDATALRLLAQLETLLAGVAADPGRRLSDLPLLAEAERALLAEWSDSAAAYPSERCLHELFEAQADRTPEAVAVVAEGEYLTYGELDRRANRLAHCLIARGVGREVAVAVRLERSPALVVALLAVQKAGGFYVPVDPEYPAERQAFLLEDSGARAVLTGAETVADTLTDTRDDRPAGRAVPDSLLCLIYTSGSTGVPKGVMVRHRGIVNRLLWAQRSYPVTAADRVLHKASFSFDFSLWEIFGPLLAGGAVVLAAPGGQRDAAGLARTIADEGITMVHFVPSMLRAFLAEEGGLERCTALRAVFSGGEALPPDLAAALLARTPAVLRNQYGPTEVSINATARICRPDDRPRRTVPIGRPLANAAAYVLDRSLRPVPLTATGELYLAGDGLARGYHGRAELTAERFLPDPFVGEPGGRMYRTGDLARHGTDGELEFLGRADHQVKVRGFRIEPGEIETALLAHPAVRQAVVVAHEEAPGDFRLVAYLVARDAAPAPAELIAFLRRGLPEHMVPGVLVTLPALPVNANGKLDRAALPAPGRAVGRSRLAPRTPVEELVAGIFAEVLGLDEVGAADDFFELGGHSLLAARLVARVRRALGVELPVRTVFEAPAVADLAARIAGLRAEPAPASAPIVPVPRDGELPLSFSQQRLWFLDQLEPGSPFYNLPATLRLEGRLGAAGIAALAAAFSGVVARHEVLRTVFPASGGTPRQAVLPAHPVPLPVVDLGALAEGARSAELARLAADDARRPFDLAAGPLLRVTLVRLDGLGEPEEAEHALLVNLHHIVSDGASVEILVRELAELYRAARAGAPAALPELPVQYADFAAWQRERLGGDALAGPLAYWRGTLAGLPPLELPADRPRPAVQSFRGATARTAWPAGLAAGLARLGRREGATLFMTLLTAVSALLGRTSGQEDFAVGSPVAGRDQAEAEGLIGFFVNTLVLRCGLPGDLPLREALARVREICLGAYAHQQVPFERLVEDLQPQRDLARPPLFQVMLALETRPPALALPGLAVRRDDGAGGTARFDLTLSLADRAEGLTALLEYSTDLFDAATAERMAGHLGVLLAALAEEPEEPGCRLTDLPLMTAAERVQLLDAWNRTGSAVETACLHELFAAQAARTPEAVALIAGEETLTYRELAGRAARCAGRLRAAGVGPEVLVGVFLERSADLVAALLGVLQAGGAYLPLDPAYPRERLDFLIRDAAAPVVLTRSALADALPAGGARVLLVDGEDAGAGALAAAPAPGNLAYLIYTSGSTGRPKGVAIEHRSAAAFVRWAGEVFADEELRGVLFATSVCFDLSVFELFVPLARGGAVILAEDALALAGLPAAGRVTLINTVPSAMAELLRLGAVPPSVRVVNLAGEALQAALVRGIEALGTGAAVYNLYGPSEDTTYSTFARVDHTGRPGAAPSIGRPIAGTRAYIVDRELRPVPLGVPGELCLAGAGLARGYLGRPEATAERFVPDPFAAEPGGRLYRTGDLARHRGEEGLDFLGRIDRQVKLRGYRIELGEVEAALRAQPGVAAAAAAVRAGDAGPRLVGYAVAESGVDLAAAVLRRGLAARLPAPLVPAAIVLLPALPLTPNGKVDVRALPAPAVEKMEEMEEMEEGAGRIAGATAPRTPAEELIAGIWASVLGRGPVGLHDSFFALGGHSLLAARVAARVRELFRVELPVRALFQAPTVAALAREVEALRASGLPEAAPLAPCGGAPQLSFGQERLWFLDRLEAGSPVYNVPAGLRLRGPLAVDALRRSFGEVVRRHAVLRSSFPAAAGKPVARIAPWQPLELPVLDLSGLPAEERARRAMDTAAAEARRPFDLAAGPLLRLLLLRLGAEDHLAVVTLHHIVSDAGSLNILLDGVAACYRAFVAGEAPMLPELPVQYADYAAWQRAWLTGDVLAAQLAWWRDRLADAPVLELPADRPRPPVQGTAGAVASAPLPAGLPAALAGLAASRGATPFMVLLAAFGALLSRSSGQLRVVVGTPVSGRRRVETEGLIGFFANTLALRADLAGAPSFAGLLERVREEALGAYDRDLPFEKLVEELRPERSLSHAPLVQVMLSLETPAAAPELSGLRLERLDLATGTAKLDCTLFVSGLADAPRAALQYRTDLFDGSTAARLLGHFETLLMGAVADPSLPVAALPLLREEERHQLLVECNATDESLPAGLTVPAMIAARAARQPSATALWCGGARWTYGELDGRAARLARRLRRLGVGPETLVAVCAERTERLPLALLAVLRAGGAYVPLDPAYPRDRIAFMLEDSGAAVLLTESHLLEKLPPHGAAVICLDREGLDREDGTEETAEPVARLSPENLAYVIYTSGSTGRPKGVAMRHGGVVALARWAAGVFPAADLDGVLASTSVCFDLSVFELFVTWSLGGRVVLTRDALALPEAAASGDVRLVNTVPSALAELLRTGGLPASVRAVCLAGEPLQRHLVEAVYATGTVERVLNLYGPSEDTTYSTWAVIPPGGLLPPSIGRPIANTAVYLLDAEGGAVPAGVPGELYLGGAGLARGYLGRPGLTAERFVPDPFSPEPGRRLYRTGDLARYRAHGEIEFLGRLDHQVKVRGFRIELGEIEAALLALPGVREAAVLAREAAAGGQRLVAYLSCAGPEPSAAELRDGLRERLPDFMLPNAFVVLPALPLLPNGKLDRKALPAPDVHLGAAAAYAEPRTPEERRLAQIWAELLGLDRVGIHDNFFELGGHSLLAVQALFRVQEETGVELALQRLFEAPTIAGLGELIAAAGGREAAAEEILPVARERFRRGAGVPAQSQGRSWSAS